MRWFWRESPTTFCTSNFLGRWKEELHVKDHDHIFHWWGPWCLRCVCARVRSNDSEKLTSWMSDAVFSSECALSQNELPLLSNFYIKEQSSFALFKYLHKLTKRCWTSNLYQYFFRKGCRSKSHFPSFQHQISPTTVREYTHSLLPRATPQCSAVSHIKLVHLREIWVMFEVPSSTSSATNDPEIHKFNLLLKSVLEK